MKLTDGERYPDALPFFDIKEVIDISSFINNYSKEELENIVQSSFSYSEVLSKLGYSTSNGRNNKTLKDRLKHYNISTEHFTYKTPKRDWTDEEIFCKESKVSQNTLRRVFKERNFVPYKCDVCELEPFWNGQPLVLTLDHKNGNNKDNRIENLHWICPNCDRQSDTYGIKNKKILQKNIILHPGNYDEKQDKNNQISKPKNESYIPPKQELKDKLWELKNYTQVGNYYNVSPTQIRRWCRKYNLPATINIIKHTSECGWINENWNDDYQVSNAPQEPKPCYMIDKETDEVIMEFSSRKAAGTYINPKSKKADVHIGQVCAGRRQTAYGYKWKDKQ